MDITRKTTRRAAYCGMLLLIVSCAEQREAPPTISQEEPEAGSVLGMETPGGADLMAPQAADGPATAALEAPAVDAPAVAGPNGPAMDPATLADKPMTSDKTNADAAAKADTPPAEKSVTPEPAVAPLPTAVTLGDPTLTSGISGSGALRTEQISQWLDTPGVHETLQVSLPLGLNFGEKDMQGLDANPLTRAKIELGRQLYFDPRLSSDSTISCASCHDPQQGYAAQTQFGVGVGGQTGNRNSPTSYNRILSGAQFWDGRADSLEEQAVGPIANPIEMANTHEVAVQTVQDIDGYRMQFDAVFGPDSVNIDNIGKAIATFERAIVTGPSPYDYFAELKKFRDNFSADDLDALKEDQPDLYADYEQALSLSEAHPMSDSAKRGMELFFSDRAACSACHVGANLSDEKYHNLGVGMAAEEPDLGRFVVTGEEQDKGAFKTPTIRNVELTAPYMHDGSQATLEEVVKWYVQGGHPNPQLDEKIKKLDLNDQEQQDLVAFMRACTGDFPQVETARLPE